MAPVSGVLNSSADRHRDTSPPTDRLPGTAPISTKGILHARELTVLK